MHERVGADLVAPGRHGVDDLRCEEGAAAEREERGVRVVLGQEREQARGERRAGPVVVGQDECALLAAARAQRRDRPALGGVARHLGRERGGRDAHHGSGSGGRAQPGGRRDRAGPDGAVGAHVRAGRPWRTSEVSAWRSCTAATTAASAQRGDRRTASAA